MEWNGMGDGTRRMRKKKRNNFVKHKIYYRKNYLVENEIYVLNIFLLCYIHNTCILHKMPGYQITTYTHKDENNKWLIKPYDKDLSSSNGNNVAVEFVRNGDLIRLEHVQTKRNLHSHREKAPITKKHHQITGYGEVCAFFHIKKK